MPFKRPFIYSRNQIYSIKEKKNDSDNLKYFDINLYIK